LIQKKYIGKKQHAGR